MINPFAVLASAVRRTIRSIFVLVFVTLYAPPEEEPQQGPQEGLQEEPESRSKLIHELQTALAAAGRTYLGGLAGEQTVALVQKVRGGDVLEGFEEIRNAQCSALMMANCVNSKMLVMKSVRSFCLGLETLFNVKEKV